MATSPTDMGERNDTAQRTAIRRTAWITAACALASYALFLASVIGGR
jgi:hypothetical protein